MKLSFNKSSCSIDFDFWIVLWHVVVLCEVGILPGNMTIVFIMCKFIDPEMIFWGLDEYLNHVSKRLWTLMNIIDGIYQYCYCEIRCFYSV